MIGEDLMLDLNYIQANGIDNIYQMKDVVKFYFNLDSTGQQIILTSLTNNQYVEFSKELIKQAERMGYWSGLVEGGYAFGATVGSLAGNYLATAYGLPLTLLRYGGAAVGALSGETALLFRRGASYKDIFNVIKGNAIGATLTSSLAYGGKTIFASAAPISTL